MLLLLLYIQGGHMPNLVGYVEPIGSENKHNQKQMYFLICKSCYWCASAPVLYLMKNETIPPKCPLCDNRISVIPISRVQYV